MSIIITGGAGFIGLNFVRLWLSKGLNEKIINLDKLTYAEIDGPAEFIKTNINGTFNENFTSGIQKTINFYLKNL